MQQEFGDHPFCKRQIYVGGKRIFTQGLSEEEGNNVIEAITNQGHFESIILPFLSKIDYDQMTELAVRWHIADEVVIDPAIRFGKPIVEETGIATHVLRQSFYANNEDADFVAKWFGVERRHIEAAVAFENSLAA